MTDRVHACPLAGCTGKRARTELLCPAHWFEAPKRLRDELWRTYRRFGVLSDPYLDARKAIFAQLGYDEDGEPLPRPVA